MKVNLLAGRLCKAYARTSITDAKMACGSYRYLQGLLRVQLVCCLPSMVAHCMGCRRLSTTIRMAGRDDQSEPAEANKLSKQEQEVFIQGSDTSFLTKLLFISIGGMTTCKLALMLLSCVSSEPLLDPCWSAIIQVNLCCPKAWVCQRTLAKYFCMANLQSEFDVQELSWM